MTNSAHEARMIARAASESRINDLVVTFGTLFLLALIAAPVLMALAIL